MSEDPKFRPETLAVRAGYDPQQGANAAKPPIFMTSTFAYASAQQAKDIHEAYFDNTGPEVGRTGHIYSRLGHPNLDMVETRLAALDGAEAAAVFNSGMATHTAIALAHVRAGDSVVHSRPIYGGTDGLYNKLMPELGAHSFSFTDGCDEASIRVAVDAALAKGPLKLIVIETPANPTAALVDIALAVRIAAESTPRPSQPRPLVVVDNTLLGPLMQRPIELGADLCMTSLTKYCGGHSDLLAGGVSGTVAAIAPLRLLRTTLGSHLDPYTCWLMLRSMETVHLRVERAMDNARVVAGFLQGHAKVASVTYLGFTPLGTPARAVYERQCKAAGSTFSFRVKGDEAAAFRFLDKLRLLRFAVSLGGSETLITHPATTTHYSVAEAQRAAVGINAATLRVSVGIEHVDDLVDDLRQALEAV